MLQAAFEFHGCTSWTWRIVIMTAWNYCGASIVCGLSCGRCLTRPLAMRPMRVTTRTVARPTRGRGQLPLMFFRLHESSHDCGKLYQHPRHMTGRRSRGRCRFHASQRDGSTPRRRLVALAHRHVDFAASPRRCTSLPHRHVDSNQNPASRNRAPPGVSMS